jgi:hypothetical protein
VLNTRDLATRVVLTFSGPVDAASAQTPALYRLTTAAAGGSSTPRAGRVIKLHSAVYDAADHAVILTPSKPIAVTKPVRLWIGGTSPKTVEFGLGGLISGTGAGRSQSRRTAVTAASPRGATRGAVALGPSASGGRPSADAASVDALLEQDQVAGLMALLHAGHETRHAHRRE